MRICLSLALILRAAMPAFGQPQTIRITAAPAGAPVPALRYELLPELRDMHSGNAALLYQRAHAPEWFSSFRRHPDYAKLPDWLDLPDHKMPWRELPGLLPGNALKEVDLAARREYCDWELTDRLRRDGFFLLLPDAQGFREYATLLALRARLAIHENKLDEAVYTFQTGFALSRHTADAPTLINGLIGIAIANVMLAQVDRFVEYPGAPNLYWALTDLPRPFISLRRCYQGERITLDDSVLPKIRTALKNPAAPPLSSPELQEIVRKLTQVDAEFTPPVVALAAAKIYPKAKILLIQRGFTAAQVDQLPVVQVAFMHALAEYDRHFDDFAKWVSLPFWEARPGLRKAEAALKSSKAKFLETGGIPLAETLIPATQSVVRAKARLERRIAALRCVEALRLYAAGHDNRLPLELSEIREVPVPADPFSGKSFRYQLEGSTAVLTGPPPEGEQASANNSLRYEITLR